MTIVVGAASPDGIVLAADSRTTLTWEKSERHRIATDSAEKVFELRGKFAVATYGTAFLGEQTINGVMNEFVASHADSCDDVEACAKALGEFFIDRFNTAFPKYKPDASGGWPLGFVVAGYRQRWGWPRVGRRRSRPDAREAGGGDHQKAGVVVAWADRRGGAAHQGRRPRRAGRRRGHGRLPGRGQT